MRAEFIFMLSPIRPVASSGLEFLGVKICCAKPIDIDSPSGMLAWGTAPPMLGKEEKNEGRKFTSGWHGHCPRGLLRSGIGHSLLQQVLEALEFISRFRTQEAQHTT
jgi:hypothetical protein